MSLLTPTPCSPQGSVSSAPWEHGCLTVRQPWCQVEKPLRASPHRSVSPTPSPFRPRGQIQKSTALEKSSILAPLP